MENWERELRNYLGTQLIAGVYSMSGGKVILTGTKNTAIEYEVAIRKFAKERNKKYEELDDTELEGCIYKVFTKNKRRKDDNTKSVN